MLSLFIFAASAVFIALLNLGFDSGLGIPNFAATEISLINRENNFALFLS